MWLMRIAGWFGVCLVIVLSVIPGEIQIRMAASKGFEHASAYFVLGLVLSTAYGGSRSTASRITFLLIVLSGALEIFQTWCPGRTPSVADWLYGAAGATIGVLVYMGLTRIWHGYVEGQLRGAASTPTHRQHCSAVDRAPVQRTEDKDRLSRLGRFRL
jgi:hypothetical protein